MHTVIGLEAAGVGVTMVPESVQLLHWVDIGYTTLLEPNATSPMILSRRTGAVAPGVTHSLSLIDQLLNR